MPLIIALILLFFNQSVFSVELYRYQDSNGNWVFGDKRSLGNNKEASSQAEKLTLVGNKPVKAKPELIKEHVPASQLGAQQWRLTNPLPVDIQHWLAVKGQKTFLTSVTVKPFQEIVLSPHEYGIDDKNQGIDHFYLLGKPVDSPKQRVIPPPFSAKKRYQVSQGFNGRYSHTGQGNRYAIDIAMAIGESVNAVMPGIVADARDDFSMGGAANYFLDKANHITVMHKDGSYAIYAHILYGSLEVSIGDQVKQGQKLARVGNTGFSTGPHLHFVMRYNSGAGAYSIPFKLDTDKGIKLPREGRYYSPRLMNKN